MASARCQPLLGSSLQKTNQTFMTKNYKPRLGFSLTQLKSCAESSKESQQKVKQNIIKVIAVTISTHILKKLSRPKVFLGNFPEGARKCMNWKDRWFLCVQRWDQRGLSLVTNSFERLERWPWWPDDKSNVGLQMSYDSWHISKTFTFEPSKLLASSPEAPV